MSELLLTEAEVHERLGLRTLNPIVVPSKAPKVNLRRLKFGGQTYLRRADVVSLLRAESEQLGGDPILDKLARLLVEVTT